MITYRELRQKHQREVNDFPFMFAFNDKQFEDGMKKLGLDQSDTDKIYRYGNTGGFYRREDAPGLREMGDRHEREMDDAMNADPTGEGFIKEMFSYELSNHEYVITGDVTDALDALGFSMDDVLKDQRLVHGLELARKAQAPET